MLFLLLAIVLSEPHEKTRGNNDRVTEIVHSLFLDCRPSLLYHFLLLSSFTPNPFPSDVLAEWPVYRYMVRVDIPCDDIISERLKI